MSRKACIPLVFFMLIPLVKGFAQGVEINIDKLSFNRSPSSSKSAASAAPAATRAMNDSFLNGLAGDVISGLAEIVLTRVQESGYGLLKDEAILAITEIEKVKLPNGNAVKLENTRAYLDTPGLKAIVAEPRPFVETLVEELGASFIAGLCTVDAPQWAKDAGQLAVDTLQKIGKKKISASDFLNAMDKAARGALSDLSKKAKNTPQYQNGIVAASVAFTRLTMEQIDIGDEDTYIRLLETVIKDEAISLSNEQKENALAWGKDLLRAYSYFTSDTTRNDIGGFVPPALELCLDMVSFAVKDDFARIALALKPAIAAIASEDFETVGALVSQLPEILKPLVGGKAKRGISVIASIAEYSLYYADSLKAAEGDQARLKALRADILKEFIAANTDRSKREGDFVVSLEGDLGFSGTFFMKNELTLSFDNIYSLCFGLAGDWYILPKGGMHFQVNAIDLGSYLSFSDGEFKIPEGIELAEAIIPSAEVAWFFDKGILINVGFFFSYPRSADGNRSFSTALRLGASVPLFDLN